MSVDMIDPNMPPLHKGQCHAVDQLGNRVRPGFGVVIADYLNANMVSVTFARVCARECELRACPDTVVEGAGGECREEEMRAGCPALVDVVLLGVLHRGIPPPLRARWAIGVMERNAGDPGRLPEWQERPKVGVQSRVVYSVPVEALLCHHAGKGGGFARIRPRMPLPLPGDKDTMRKGKCQRVAILPFVAIATIQHQTGVLYSPFYGDTQEVCRQSVNIQLNRNSLPAMIVLSTITPTADLPLPRSHYGPPVPRGCP